LLNSSTTPPLTKLDALYDTILQEVCADNDKDDIEAFQSVMGQILASFEPLSLDALTAMRKHFPSGHAKSVRSVLKHMGSVLSGVTSYSIPIQPLHSSFHDYLTDCSRSKGFYIDASLHRNDLAFATLQVMKAELHFNICHLKNSYLLNSDIDDLAQKVKQFISSHLSYSCRYWASHVQQATLFHSNIAAQVREFLNQQFLYWIEVLSLVKSVQIAAHSISLIITWVNVCFHMHFSLLKFILTVHDIGSWKMERYLGLCKRCSNVCAHVWKYNLPEHTTPLFICTSIYTREFYYI
jgi:hypothetical protein